ALAGLAFAQVESVNIVGYSTITLKQGFNMLACNFDGVGEAAGMTLDELVPGTTPGLTGSGSAGNADNILVFDADSQGYTIYYLYYATKGTTTYNNQWVLNASTPAGVTLQSGDAFWLNLKNTTDLPATFVGQVPAEASKTLTLKQGFNMIGGQFTADWDPNGLGTAFWAANGTGSGSAGNADNILVFDAATQGYTIYYLYYATKGTTTYNNQWVLNASTLAPAGFVKVGTGVWYSKKAAGDLEVPISRPYSL
ncbi:MAG TPA: hypothetical protein PLE35_00535, partial [Lentisphaeria bacterium]|nr:hypothetical protein [Lentisphaeria bacterium]